jgi:hypothetical protein
MVGAFDAPEEMDLATYRAQQARRLETLLIEISANGHYLFKPGFVIHVIYPGREDEVSDDKYDYYDPKVVVPPGFVRIVLLRDPILQYAQYASFSEDARMTLLSPDQLVEQVFEAHDQRRPYSKEQCSQVLDSIIVAVSALTN